MSPGGAPGPLALTLFLLASAPATAAGRGMVRGGAEGEVGVDSNLTATAGSDDPEVYVRAAGWFAAAGAPGSRGRVDTALSGEARALPLHRRVFVAAAWQGRVRVRPVDVLEVGVRGALDAWAFAELPEAPPAREGTLEDRLRPAARVDLGLGGWSGARLGVWGLGRVLVDPAGETPLRAREVLGEVGVDVPIGRATLRPAWSFEVADPGGTPATWVAHLLGLAARGPLGRRVDLEGRARGALEGASDRLGPALRAEVEARFLLRPGFYLAAGGSAYVAAETSDSESFRALLAYVRVGHGLPPLLVTSGRGLAPTP